MGRQTVQSKIQRKRRRRAKIQKLKAKLAKTKGQTDIEALIVKLRKVSPFYPGLPTLVHG